MSRAPRRLPASIVAAAAEADAAEQQLHPTPAAPAAVEPVVAAAAEPAPAAAVADSEEVLAQKHRTLQGIHAAQLRKIQEQSEQLRELQAQLQSATAHQPDQASVQANTAQLRDGLGADMHDLLEERIRAIVLEVVAAQIEPLRGAMSNSVGREQERLEDLFFDRLDILQPNWEVINVHPGFLSWLSQIDPASGVPLSEHLQDARAKLDADRAVLFYRSYEREVAANARPAPTPAPSTQRHPTPQPTSPRVFTGAQIDTFFNDLRIGKYRGRDAEALAIEQDIMTAQREGRVVP